MNWAIFHTILLGWLIVCYYVVYRMSEEYLYRSMLQWDLPVYISPRVCAVCIAVGAMFVTHSTVLFPSHYLAFLSMFMYIFLFAMTIDYISRTTRLLPPSEGNSFIVACVVLLVACYVAVFDMRLGEKLNERNRNISYLTTIQDTQTSFSIVKEMWSRTAFRCDK